MSSTPRSWTAPRLAAGAVCTVRRMRNPVIAARAVLDDGRVVLLAGAAADDFAQARGWPWSSPAYFTTQRRVDALALAAGQGGVRADPARSEAEKHGTVGAVARDCHGHLAAATSTGGFNNKAQGRVGDSPIIGAGTYARDGVCAVSCTGQGEIFIRRVAAYDVAARMSYGGQTLADAAHTVVFETMTSHGIGAGMVVLGATGNALAPYNTLGMYRGWIITDGRADGGDPQGVARHGTSVTVQREPILIWGAGAIGGVLGAYWARAGLPVLMVDIVEAHVQACRSSGLKISGPVEQFTQVVQSVTAGRTARRLLDHRAGGEGARHRCGAGHARSRTWRRTATCCRHRTASTNWPSRAPSGNERTMGCFVNFGADWLGPGEILFGNRAAVVVGEIDGSIRERTRQMHRDLVAVRARRRAHRQHLGLPVGQAGLWRDVVRDGADARIR